MAQSLRTSLLAVLAACSAPAAPKQPTPPPMPAEPPVVVAPPDAAPPTKLADDVPTLRLPKTFVATGYTATLKVDPATPTFTGKVVIDGTITSATNTVWLHAKNLEFSSVIAAGTPTLTKHGEDLIALHFEQPVQPGAFTMTFEYTATLEPTSTAGAFVQKVAGSSYVYSQLEALHARRVFPCIDEPDSKVPWQLTLDVPKGNVAVSNTPIAKESEAKGWRHIEFAKTKPLPTYLVAFGVGPFDVVDAGKTKSGVPVRIVTLKGRGPDAAYAAQSTAKILGLVETWFGTPYPYEKLDILTIPLTIGFGAMENAGLITQAENIMLFDPKALSHEQRNTYAVAAAHEISHQWFGNLVTMAWWDDLWLNEGFANWLETKIAAQFEPAWDYELAGYDEHQYALASDSLVTARRVRQPITTIDDIESAFDGITYSKGAAMLAMFENFVGPEVFRKGVRDYIKARSWANATSSDFVSAISAAAGKDLGPAFASFLEQVGAPEIDTKLVCEKGRVKLEVTQQRYVAPGSAAPTTQQTWQIPLCIAFESSGKRATTCSLFTEKSGSIALPTKSCPRWTMPNADGNGHYRVRYSQQQAQALRDEAWEKLTASEQRSVFADAHAMVSSRERRLPLQLALSFVPKLLAKANRFVVNDALSVPWSIERTVPSDLADKYAYYMRTTFGPGAAKLGLVAAAKETLDDESLRTSLVSAAAWDGRDPDLVAKAVELFGHWRDLPASTRRLVLRIAVDADANVAAKVMRDVKTEQDRARRQEMIAALASQRDMKRYDAALELVLDPALDIRETMTILWSTSTEATRATAERFLRINEAKVLAKFPNDAVLGLAADFASVFAGSCDPAKRDEAKAYATEHYAKLPGGAAMTAQVFEQMDKCIANREIVLPQLRAWLGGLKVPKPTKR